MKPSFVAPELAGLGDASALFNRLGERRLEVYRELENRRTFRFEYNGRHYFAKQHFGVGWREIFKNLLSLRLPVLGASNEWDAIAHLEHLGINTLHAVAFAEAGRNPARRQSYIVTRALENTLSLEDLARAGPIPQRRRRRLIRAVAQITRTMHQGGMNHRDLYICHFHLAAGSEADRPRLYLIDLHRAQIRRRTPYRWRLKDIAGLLFSTLDFEFTQRDYLLFVTAYSGKSLRQTLTEERQFWRDVVKRAGRLYQRESGSVPRRLQEMWL